MKKFHSKLLKVFFYFYHGSVFFLCYRNGHNRERYYVRNGRILGDYIYQVLFDIETRGREICIDLGLVTICIPIGTIELLYIFYNTG